MKRDRSARAMKLAKVVGISASALFATVWAGPAQGQLIPLLDSNDTAIGIDVDSVPVGAMNNGRYPNAENPPKAIDGIISGSKYLNFGGAGSGFIVSPALSGVPVDGFQITTGNDAPGRDPASYALYGFNGTLVTTDSGPTPAINQTGLAEAWTLISSGPVTLPGNPTIGNDQRGVLGPMVSIGSTTGYQHYKMIFPSIKRPSDNIMQIAEIQFFADDLNPGSGILSPTDPIIAVDETPIPPGFSGSSSPANEGPARGIDQSRDPITNAPNTKYLNFGEERSGLIITNSGGPVKVDVMGLTTANDVADRDPSSFELYGTNDPIQSQNNSNGNGGESWTLIASGPLSLPGDVNLDDGRGVETQIPINSPTAYSSYKVIFPTTKNPTGPGADSMQIADVQFYTVPEPSAMLLVVGALTVLGRSRRRNG